MKQEKKKKKQLTASWLATESCWLVEVTRMDPVADFAPDKANELWVVNHAYWLNGRPFT